ncbi:MAG: NB-ARC domain-containing protein [Chloroflexota bacterium]
MTPSINRQQMLAATRDQLRAWYRLSETGDTLYPSLLLVQKKLADKNSTVPSMRRLAINQVLWDGIKFLQEREPQLAELLTHRYPDKLTMKGTGLRMALSQHQVKHLQVQAIEALTDTLLMQELDLRQTQMSACLAALPQPTYTRLFGLDAMEQLFEQFMTETERWIWAVVGIGGVGKTALADFLARKVIKTAVFHHVAWVWMPSEEKRPFTTDTLTTDLWQQLIQGDPTQVAPPDQHQQLRHHFQQKPTLIIIDNLETAEQVNCACSYLHPLANPSRVLLTSREQATARAGLHHHLVRTLSKTAAFQLLRSYGTTDLTHATDPQLEQIWQLTGGHPLALKLVAGLAAVLPLPAILADFITVETNSTADLYRYIYRRAYHALTPEGSRLLRIMPLAAGDGMPLEQMAAISQLSKTDLWAAIRELVRHSLLEPSGSTWERTYRIHRLTQSFLQTEIIHLPDRE